MFAQKNIISWHLMSKITHHTYQTRISRYVMLPDLMRNYAHLQWNCTYRKIICEKKDVSSIRKRASYCNGKLDIDNYHKFKKEKRETIVYGSILGMNIVCIKVWLWKLKTTILMQILFFFDCKPRRLNLF